MWLSPTASVFSLNLVIKTAWVGVRKRCFLQRPEQNWEVWEWEVRILAGNPQAITSAVQAGYQPLMVSAIVSATSESPITRHDLLGHRFICIARSYTEGNVLPGSQFPGIFKL